MVFYQPRDVRSALLPINSICWFFGIGVIEYTVGYPRRTLSFVRSTAVLILFLTCTSVADLTNFISDSMTPPSVIRVYIMGSSMTVIFVCCNIFFSIIYSKKRSDCIVTLEQINEIMGRMGIVRSYQSVLMAQIWQFGTLVLVSFLFAIIIFINSVSRVGIAKISSICFSILYPTVISTSYAIMFCSFDALMTCAFKDLNSLLESLRFKLADQPRHTRNNSVEVDVVSRQKRGLKMAYSIRKIYSRLVRLTKQWNRLNAVFILIESASLIFHFSNNICIVHGILQERVAIGSTNFWVVANILLVLGFSVGKFVMIVRSTVCLTSEANRTCEIVLQYLHPIASLRSEVRTFSMQIIHNPLRLSVLGLLPLDYSLIQEIFTSVVTYVVVIIQMSRPSEINEN